MQFRANNGGIYEWFAPMRANQIARITSDFKMNLIYSINTIILFFRQISFVMTNNFSEPYLF